ncbi:MAG: glycine cleavage system protein H [Planctomycetes bacterium]|nr:glycine cleavage system protein H [Planctomycetota bacterium]
MQDLPLDLFATKSLEYVLILGFLAALVAFWWLLNRRVESPATLLPAGPHAQSKSGWFQVALERLYHPGHAWAKPDEAGLVTVGVDDFAQKLVGAPSSIELPAVGEHVHQGGAASRLAVGERSVEIVAPLEGEVVERNEALLAEPGRVNRDPYGSGWLYKIRPAHFEADREQLLENDDAARFADEMEERLRRRMSPSFGLLLQDGGVPVSGLARVLAGERWDEFARDFLIR